MKELEYDEFEVLLERSGDGFSARVVDSPTGPSPAMPFVRPAEAAELPELRRTMRGATEAALTGEGAPAGPPESPGGASATAGPKAFGIALFEALFNDKALSILRTSQFVAAKHGRGLRLRIRFGDAAELANLPWELLYDPMKHKFPCQYQATPTIRLLDLPEPVPPLRVTGPLRMLVVISGPKDLPELDAEKEWMQVQEELAPLVEAGRIELVRLAVPTLAALHAKVLAEEFHVFHFVGHGGIDASGEGHLAFTWPTGLAHKVQGSHLGVMLSNSPIRLAVLNSCQGGTVSAEDPYGSSAIALVQQGIPAVIAMQFPISDDAARTFSRTLYDSVAAGRSVDLGVTLGRQAVLATSETEWATPVLYLRGQDGVLFELEDGPVDTILEDPADVVGPPSGPMIIPPDATQPPEPQPPEPQPSAPLLPPAPPMELAGSVHGGRVELRWGQEVSPDVPVLDWEVYRDDSLISRVLVPKVVDEPGAPGAYRYTVIAAGKGALRSEHSAPWEAVVPAPVLPETTPEPPGLPDTPDGPLEPSAPQTPPDRPLEVKVRRLRRVPVAILLVLAVALVGWLTSRQGGAAVAAPANVTTTLDAGLVSMSWDTPPEDGPHIDHWEVYLGDELIQTVGEPTTSFRPEVFGELDYRVVAVTADGTRSTGAAAPVSVPEPKPEPEPDPQPEPKPKPKPEPEPTTADIEISVVDVQAAEGDAETITFETDNLGAAEVEHEQVFVQVVDDGQLYEVSFSFGGDGALEPCAVEGLEASCDIGPHALKGVVHVVVTVGWAPTSSVLRATVSDEGGTTDPDEDNNVAEQPRPEPSDPGPTPGGSDSESTTTQPPEIG